MLYRVKQQQWLIHIIINRASEECSWETLYSEFFRVNTAAIYSARQQRKHETNQFWGMGSRKSVKISFSTYSIGDKAESSLSSDAHTDDDCDSTRDTFGADRARDNVCEWDVDAAGVNCPAAGVKSPAAGVNCPVLWLVEATVMLPSVTAALTVTKKLHKSVRLAGRADGNKGRPTMWGNSGMSPNYNKHTHQLSKLWAVASIKQQITYHEN